ncbi:hypothetical protein JOD57_002867 [Geodermatophilus bullaregiensis]|uniref:DUF6318 family protein n=1 Tax=Geodermatophilus bullaregiensis TaxID=1564160 RepID=UPI0019588182|nr:DUF6318 family protein [Geodermatophilus bullaregiensis]MBM7807030.1 hypothetical protein [Geodermatophilus bullaregiensis]
MITNGGGRSMGRLFRTAAALAVAAAALAGCSEAEPANATLPTATAEPAPTTEALPPLGPADFPMPPEAREKTPEGAVEFTRYYVRLIEYVGDGSLDPQPLIDLSSNCEVCLMIADSYSEDRAAGYTYDDVTVSFEEYGPGLINGDTAEVGFVYTQNAITVLDSAGEVMTQRSSDATGDLQSGALLQWRPEQASWVTTSLTIG